MRVLLLGGTGEARELAALLLDAPGIEVISSLAGRVSQPRLPVGPVRMGGFGGVAGLRAYLASAGIDVVIDATHPFAATISANAAAAAGADQVPLLILRRPGWSAAVGDDWRWVADMTQAAAAVAAAPVECVLLTTGRRDLAVFAALPHRFVARTVDPPEGPVPARMTVLLDRGPYSIDAELALFREHGVQLLVTKDSGGEMTAAKLSAARELRLPVVVVQRPPVPPGVPLAHTLAEAVDWLNSQP